MDRRLELRHLRYFVAVAEELHFSRAAARLHLAQPPLSQQIRQLEDIVGCALLVRTSRSVQLTAAGTTFLERARRTLRTLEDDVTEARMIGRGEQGSLRLGFSSSVALTILPGLLQRYRARSPGVQLQLQESFTAQVMAGLREGTLDAGLVRDSDPAEEIGVTRLFSEPFVAVVPRNRPYASQPEISASVLKDEPFVYYPRDAGARAFEKPLSLCETHGFRPRIAQEASHWLTILQLIDAGLGVSIAPACVAQIAPPSLACLPLRGVSVTSDVELVQRLGEQRPLIDVFSALAVTAGAQQEGAVFRTERG
ncbi:LysR substrate-binding domain-containing protein [Deinococcus hopiensis]|uniref:DNA-binding transcriptional regulator, LysR family n=1 Tax=Deinococcus hopiensis KR-140 TaxID=695939 RepID=A0A1W1VDS1_9DEIO|nr:LysR substrate-binding domain-containing protein [Deinococcus hopiensis]SMB91094.1 DNA-binding transcriptional regulator, LysR family [Deinococcus hopiensis KR-140]